MNQRKEDSFHTVLPVGATNQGQGRVGRFAEFVVNILAVICNGTKRALKFLIFFP